MDNLEDIPFKVGEEVLVKSYINGVSYFIPGVIEYILKFKTGFLDEYLIAFSDHQYPGNFMRIVLHKGLIIRRLKND